MTVMPGFISSAPIDYNEIMRTWAKAWETIWTSNTNPADWRMWLPRAVWMNWSDPKTWQTRFFDPTTWQPVAFSPPEERERVMTMINIAGNYIKGDMSKGDLIKDIDNAEVITKASVKDSNIRVPDQKRRE